ncbi:MAG: S1 family peptidase [Methanosarcinales archaeon]|jgi:hypothetical protein|nr:S1 family peptidase [Methanosarcinales archaeon]
MSVPYDTIFVPQTTSRQVRPYIYDGAGNDLKVTGLTGSVSNNMLVEKSGITSGFTQGYYQGSLYDTITISYNNSQGFNTLERVGVLYEKDYNANVTGTQNISYPGDSGGPIFSKFGNNAIIFGTLAGGDGEGTVSFIYGTDIRDELGVVPLK